MTWPRKRASTVVRRMLQAEGVQIWSAASASAVHSREKVAFGSPPEKQQAQGRFEIIKRLLDKRAIAKAGGKTKLARLMATTNELSERTIWQCVSASSKGTFPALVDKTRSDKGTSRFFKAHPQSTTVAAYLYLEQRQGIRSAYEAIGRDRSKLGLSGCVA